MNSGPTVFAQILAGIDPKEVARCAEKFPMPRQSRGPSVFDHFAAMVFAQLTNRRSLRDGFVVVRQLLTRDELVELSSQLDRDISDVVPTLPETHAFYVDKSL